MLLCELHGLLILVRSGNLPSVYRSLRGDHPATIGYQGFMASITGSDGTARLYVMGGIIGAEVQHDIYEYSVNEGDGVWRELRAKLPVFLKGVCGVVLN